MTCSRDTTVGPLQRADPFHECGIEAKRTNVSKEEASSSGIETTTAILHWTVERVSNWLQENVPFNQDRMQECFHSFQANGVDGLCLLTLQRNHQACVRMTDFEWVLLKTARKRLLSGGGKVDLPSTEKLGLNCNLHSSFLIPPCTPRRSSLELNSQASPQSYKTTSRDCAGLRHDQGALMFVLPRSKFSFPKLPWLSDAAKDEKIEMLVAEVQMLRGEILSAEEREIALQAQMQHLDEMLRNAIIAEYIFTRTRWVPHAGESLLHNDADGWLQRFLVLQGSSIFFYLRATDLTPQGTILLDDIVEVGPLPVQAVCEGNGQQWFYFHVTTCRGLRLECSTPCKLQMEFWLTTLGVDIDSVQKCRHLQPT